MKKLRIGIIGSGFGLYGLLPSFNSLNNCQVVCMCGKKTERLVKYCSSIGLKNIYTNWQKMLKSEKLDAVAVAVTPSAQHGIVKTALNLGIHVFAEKPLALNLSQAKELYELAKKKRLTNAVDFIFPEIDEWQKAKEIIDSQVYGKLISISADWDFLSYDIKNGLKYWKTDSAKGGGALAYYFSHVLYYLEYFAGEIVQLKNLLSHSKESKNGGEVGVDSLLKFKKGVIGRAHLSCNNHIQNRHILVFICEKGQIVLENQGTYTQNFSLKVYWHGKVKKLLVRQSDISKSGEDERVRVIKKIARRFITACQKKQTIVPSFHQGLRVQELIEQIKNNNFIN